MKNPMTLGALVALICTSSLAWANTEAPLDLQLRSRVEPANAVHAQAQGQRETKRTQQHNSNPQGGGRKQRKGQSQHN
jgi:hypothetical protein